MAKKASARRLCRILGCFALIVAVCVLPSPMTAAAEPCGSVAAGMDPQGLVTAEEWVECPDPAAVGVTSIVPTSFAETSGEPVAVLTTGKVSDVSAPNDGQGTTTEFNTVARGAWDVSSLRLDVTVPADANCLAFDFAFASEELSEFRGSEFNDGFVAELDGSSWSVSSGGSIDATDNFATDAGGALISINSATYREEIDTGTEYDGATDRLVAQTPASPGEHSLYLSIFDAGDPRYDSAVWLANLRAEQHTDGPCAPGVNQVPVAEISALPIQGTAPLEVDFSGVDSSDDGEIVEYDWDFGDAQRSSGAEVSHTYVTGGTHTARLTITDDDGASASATVDITVEGGNIAPEAEFDLEPDFGDPPLTVAFDASGSHDASESAQTSSSSSFAAGRTTTMSMSLAAPASPRANDPKTMTLTGGLASAAARRPISSRTASVERDRASSARDATCSGTKRNSDAGGTSRRSTSPSSTNLGSTRDACA